jgi:hypothetical protein
MGVYMDVCTALGAQLGSIADIVYRVRGKLLNRSIGELSSAVLGGDIRR